MIDPYLVYPGDQVCQDFEVTVPGRREIISLRNFVLIILYVLQLFMQFALISLTDSLQNMNTNTSFN